MKLRQKESEQSLLRCEWQNNWVIRKLTKRNYQPSLSLTVCCLTPSLNSHLQVGTILTAALTSTVPGLCNTCASLYFVQWSLSLFSGTNTSNSITSSISLCSLPVQRIHYNGTRVSHFSLDEGFACLWSLFQPRHADGFLRPVVCPVQVVSHPVHSYALYGVDSWGNYVQLVRSLLLQLHIKIVLTAKSVHKCKSRFFFFFILLDSNLDLYRITVCWCFCIWLNEKKVCF